ncbi:MAG: right-handed parallel beta-helix repeat-containing protein [Acidimicrobiales bacterium]
MNRSIDADQAVSVTARIPTVNTAGNGLYLAATLRGQSNGDSYRARARIAPGGVLTVAVYRVRGGNQATVIDETQVPGTVVPGAELRLEAYVDGTTEPTVAVRAWVAGTDRPAYRTAVDSSGSAIDGDGRVGIWAYVSGSSSASSVDLTSLTASTLSSAGSAPVGGTAYPAPADAVFVAPDGSDQTGSGSITAPYQTVKMALRNTPANRTIVLREGSYHEKVFVPDTAKVVIQSYPNEAVWFDGTAPVTGWRAGGTTWVADGWTAGFDHWASFTKGHNDPTFLAPDRPLAAHPDQVFFDGEPLAQVQQNPGPGQFAIDEQNDRITVGSDPTGVEVRASDLSTAFVVAGQVTLRGFGIRGYATSVPEMGTVYFGGRSDGSVVENVVVADNATQGLSVGDVSNVTIDRVTAQRNGMTGMHAAYSDGLVIKNSLIVDNNAEGFPAAPSTGGIKVTRLNGVTITGNVVLGNHGATGIWTDETVTNFEISHNRVELGNGEYGIETELSDTGVVVGNVVSGARYGYAAYLTGNVQVYNNLFHDNSVFDLGVVEDNRRGQGPAEAPWISRNVVAANNVFADNAAGDNGGFEFYALNRATGVPADAMNITIDGNQFSPAANGAQVVSIGWGGGDNHTVTYYEDPATFPRAVENGWVNHRSHVGPTDRVVATGRAIPADIAAILGVPASSRQIGPTID